jgi:hypothetical protein
MHVAEDLLFMLPVWPNHRELLDKVRLPQSEVDRERMLLPRVAPDSDELPRENLPAF